MDHRRGKNSKMSPKGKISRKVLFRIYTHAFSNLNHHAFLSHDIIQATLYPLCILNSSIRVRRAANLCGTIKRYISYSVRETRSQCQVRPNELRSSQFSSAPESSHFTPTIIQVSNPPVFGPDRCESSTTTKPNQIIHTAVRN